MVGIAVPTIVASIAVRKVARSTAMSVRRWVAEIPRSVTLPGLCFLGPQDPIKPLHIGANLVNDE
jgi:hypothetical protein